MGKGIPLPTISAKIDRNVEAGSKPVSRFLKVRLRYVNGDLTAEPASGGSSVLSLMVDANGFVVIPPRKSLRKGEVVSVTLFSLGDFTRFSPFKLP